MCICSLKDDLSGAFEVTALAEAVLRLPQCSISLKIKSYLTLRLRLMFLINFSLQMSGFAFHFTHDQRVHKKKKKENHRLITFLSSFKSLRPKEADIKKQEFRSEKRC